MPMGICWRYSGPGTCPYGDSCRFQHIPEASTPPSGASASSSGDEPTNNRNPDSASMNKAESTFPKDAKFYQTDGSGVLLVDGILFKLNAKVQVTSIFGSRPTEVTSEPKKFAPMYIEDILPKLSNSSDVSPIEVCGITRKQFRTYLLLINGLPYDPEYMALLVDYLTPEKHNQALFLQYLDIATVAPRFGMTKLKDWSMNALETVFMESANSLRQAHYDWNYKTLLQLRELTRETELDSPVRAFIQYLIHRVVWDIRRNQGVGEHSFKIKDLIEIYQGFKKSDEDDALLGCVFLNILSLGYRSQVWSNLSRDDKAILYAAQAQLTDLPHEFASESLEWVKKPDPGLIKQLCTSCQLKFSAVWGGIFRECSEELGSEIPLKDVTLLAQMPEYRWNLWNEMSQTTPAECTLRPLTSPTTGYPATPSTSQVNLCSIRPLINNVDRHIQDTYEQTTSRYRTIVK